MSPNFSDNTNMDTIDFKKLSEQLRSELLRVNGWRKVVRTGSIAVYLFVFCWFMFVLFGGALVSYIGLENYMQFTQYIIPVFIGFIVVNFVFTRCMTNFQERESEAMQHIMSTLFPTVYFSASSQVDSRILRDSKLFSASFSDPALAANTYGYIQFPHGEHSLHVADIGVSYGLLNKLQYNPVLGYFVMIYRFVLRPLFASRLDSSPHNFRGMFAWCKIDKRHAGWCHGFHGGLPDWRGQSGRRGRCFFPAGGIRPASCGRGPSRISSPGGPVHPFSAGHKFQCPGSCRGCRIGGSRWSCCGESIARNAGKEIRRRAS